MVSTETQSVTPQQIRLADLGAALSAGLRDFRRAPQFGLFFSAVYVVGGFVMLWLGAGHVSWVLATSLGFPLIAPFAAAGLYEVSRRLEKGIALDWKGVLGIVWAERNRQLPLLGAFIVFFFLVWTFLAHIVFALFMGLSTMTNISDSWAVFLSADGIKMIFAEFVIGTVLALILFSLTVVSLPMLLDREVDVITAMLRSLQAVRENFLVMLVWAVTVAVLSLLALLPWFLGLMIVLPVLGHATWHLYRKAIA
ncbi:DUF2189 domain-containing protein [Yoonia sediminilitoris]|uniref:Putative membrane protein n=1 Tax=Yoonia sediminilitoris TaxID=1286148 RepID=A0A2T6KRE1_9RHOB|nr:DUF2189 domain-containing protein [Yoonia sediminilitoris]PUB19124.1 putative membrane protein [Yoonia sediminilitoris]RCW99292.1 putative membrane protein [Yoonia sediminilitoris]